MVQDKVWAQTVLGQIYQGPLFFDCANFPENWKIKKNIFVWEENGFNRFFDILYTVVLSQLVSFSSLFVIA